MLLNKNYEAQFSVYSRPVSWADSPSTEIKKFLPIKLYICWHGWWKYPPQKAWRQMWSQTNLKLPPIVKFVRIKTEPKYMHDFYISLNMSWKLE